MQETIIETAGKIWEYLNQNGEVTTKKMNKDLVRVIENPVILQNLCAMRNKNTNTAKGPSEGSSSYKKRNEKNNNVNINIKKIN